MDKPRIFLGSSGKQVKLLQSLARGLGEVAEVESWTTSFDPGTTTIQRLVDLTREVDFAAFVFAQDDWTSNGAPASSGAEAGQASPRDNVVFEAGLFGGVLGMRRTIILHAHGAKLPTDLLGLTCIRYGEAPGATDIKIVNQKLRQVIDHEGCLSRIEGCWWQFSLTQRTEREPSALGLLRLVRGRDGTLDLNGRSWRGDGTLLARYTSLALKERSDPPGVFYYWTGERPLDPDAPQMQGTGEFQAESAERGSGYFTTSSETRPDLKARTAGVYLRARAEEVAILDSGDDRQRAALIAERLSHWDEIRSA